MKPNFRRSMIASAALTSAALAASLIATPAAAAVAGGCADLSQMQTRDLKITKAETVTAMSAISPAVAQQAISGPFCRVVGHLAPTADSDIVFELWLPLAAQWNGKFQAVGNGGFLGALNYRAAVSGLQRRYAVMTTDLGHVNVDGATEDGRWALGHGDKVVDYAWRAQHLTVDAAKRLVARFYGRAAQHAYFTGCSAGGIRGLAELLRYPADFDGFVIGNATPNHIGQEFGAMWNTLQASLKYPADALKPQQVGAIHAEVLRQCVGKDGGLPTDTFLTDPRRCAFRPETLLCASGQDSASCLNPRQIDIVRNIYTGPRNSLTGQSYLAGIMPGSELTWDRYFTGKTNPAKADRPWASFMTYMGFAEADYLSAQKYLAFDFDRDPGQVAARVVGGEPLGSSWNNPNRNLDAFARAGGKVIQYHGWDDPNIPPLEAVNFHDGIVAGVADRRRMSGVRAQAVVDDYYRLFMVPGLGHCAGGDGPWNIGQNGSAETQSDPQRDPLTALEHWVEKGARPSQLIGTRSDPKNGAASLSRPICAYPAVAQWTGRGSSADAANFVCAAPPRLSPTGSAL